jgi:acyl dehydratase
MKRKNEVTFETVKEGDALPEFRARMERETYFAYNQLIKNMNPLHSDPEYARRLGFKDIVVAGVYTFSFIPKMVEDWIGAAGRVCGVEIRFSNPVYIEETIVQTGRVKKIFSSGGKRLLECEVNVSDSRGNPLTSATVTVEMS